MVKRLAIITATLGFINSYGCMPWAKVKIKQRRSILPPDLFQKYSEMAFWKDTAGSSANVIAAKDSDNL